ncbi:unnamed protein product, partial [Symbiodinium necroappetens]
EKPEKGAKDKDKGVVQPLPLTEVVHRASKLLAAKNAMPKLTEAVAAMVKEPDSPTTGRVREERFRSVLEEVASQELSPEELQVVFPEKHIITRT